MIDFTYDDILKQFPGAKPRGFSDSSCHPLIEHSIQLQKYHPKVERLIQLTENLNGIDDDSDKVSFLKSLPTIPKLPEYSTQTFLKNHKKKKMITNDVDLSDETVKKLLSKAIARILLVRGYTGASSDLLEEFSKLIAGYLKSLVFEMVALSPEDESVTMEALETILRQENIDGVEELYSFYRDQIVSFHDCLYSKCKELHSIVEENLKKVDALHKQDFNQSEIDEVKRDSKTSKEPENKIVYSLDSEDLAEASFLKLKFRKKFLLASSEIKNNEKTTKSIENELPTNKRTVTSEDKISTVDEEKRQIELKLGDNINCSESICVDRTSSVEDRDKLCKNSHNIKEDFAEKLTDDLNANSNCKKQIRKSKKRKEESELNVNEKVLLESNQRPRLKKARKLSESSNDTVHTITTSNSTSDQSVKKQKSRLVKRKKM